MKTVGSKKILSASILGLGLSLFATSAVQASPGAGAYTKFCVRQSIPSSTDVKYSVYTSGYDQSKCFQNLPFENAVPQFLGVITVKPSDGNNLVCIDGGYIKTKNNDGWINDKYQMCELREKNFLLGIKADGVTLPPKDNLITVTGTYSVIHHNHFDVKDESLDTTPWRLCSYIDIPGGSFEPATDCASKLSSGSIVNGAGHLAFIYFN